MSFANLSEYADTNLHHRKRKQAMDVVALFLIILAVHFVIGAFSGKWPWSGNSYNSYLLQTLSWLEGRLDLGQNYEWLELAIFQDKFYVSFPPFPSYVYLPFALIFGDKTPEGWIAFFVMLIGAFFAIRIAWHYLGTGAKAVFWSAFLYVGTNILYVTLDAGVWFIAQSMALTLSLMAIFYALKGKGGLSLFFWGCSVGCRPLQVLYAPILLYMLYRGLKKAHPDYNLFTMIKKRFYWAIPVCMIAFSYMLLNYARFGNPIQFGHDYLPEFTRSEYGQFDAHYISENIKSLFRLPVKTDSQTLAFYLFDGNCIFLVSPLFVSYFIYLLRKVITRQKIDPFLLISIPALVILHMIGLCAHKTMGGFHFGHRYINDTLAYVYLAVIMFAGTTEICKKKTTDNLKLSEETETIESADDAETITDIENDSDEQAFNSIDTEDNAQTFIDTEISAVTADAEETSSEPDENITSDYTYCLHYGLCVLGMTLNLIGSIAANMGWIS